MAVLRAQYGPSARPSRKGRSMIMFPRASERRDLHNSSIDEEAALTGHCAVTHLASGRVCMLPYRHVDGCHFALPRQ
jgi:hypothetical protein